MSADPVGPPRDERIEAAWRFIELLQQAGQTPAPELVELLVRWELDLAESCAQWAG